MAAKIHVILGTLALTIGLLLAGPALAGPADPCLTPPDTDGDGHNDVCDNCDALPNPLQRDGDQDGYGDACDCRYTADGGCDGGDFAAFAANFGTLVPPAPTTLCEFDHDGNGAIDGGDFGFFASRFGGFPGPACGNGVGGPGCPFPGTPCP